VTTPDDLVTIGWAYGVSETAVALSRLEAAGIDVLAVSGRMASQSWHCIHALGGVELRVPESQAAFAHDMLTDTEPVSPRRRTVTRLLLAMVGYLLAGVPLPPTGIIIAGASPLAIARGRPTDPGGPLS
jgi:hypothetical protein